MIKIFTKIQSVWFSLKVANRQTDRQTNVWHYITSLAKVVTIQFLHSYIAQLINEQNEAYSDITRSFATILHFYSAKAHSYVRSSFRQALPHPSVLRKWIASVDGQPGFIAEALEVCGNTACGNTAKEGVQNTHHLPGRTKTATENKMGQAGSRPVNC